MPWLHKSSWVVATVTLIICALIVLPGQITDSYFAPYPRYSHGWPSEFLKRKADNQLRSYDEDGNAYVALVSWVTLDPPPGPPWLLWDSWRFWHAEETTWKPLHLLLDVGVALAFVALVTAAWEFRRRRRANAFQFRLIEFFVITTLIAGILAWMHNHSEAYEDELQARKACKQADYIGFGFPYEQCVAPVWLQRLIGPGSFPQSFFRVHEMMLDLDDYDVSEIDALIANLQRLEYLNSIVAVSISKDAAEIVVTRIREQLPHVKVDSWELE